MYNNFIDSLSPTECKPEDILRIIKTSLYLMQENVVLNSVNDKINRSENGLRSLWK